MFILHHITTFKNCELVEKKSSTFASFTGLSIFSRWLRRKGRTREQIVLYSRRELWDVNRVNNFTGEVAWLKDFREAGILVILILVLSYLSYLQLLFSRVQLSVSCCWKHAPLSNKRRFMARNISALLLAGIQNAGYSKVYV